jgi:hypothetical protein
MLAEQTNGIGDGGSRRVVARHEKDLASHDRLVVVELPLFVGGEVSGCAEGRRMT